MAALGGLVCLFGLFGLTIVRPNDSLVCVLFGNYVGTIRRSGLWWVNPLYSTERISRKLNTFECGPLKVNDQVGNPIEIGAVIVWRVDDAAKAEFEVENYTTYVKTQSETSLRHTAGSHPYDEVEVETAAEATAAGKTAPSPEPAKISGGRTISQICLKDGGDEITNGLLAELKKRMDVAGIELEEARLTHLAYAPEIAPAMLKKQAAGAVIAARKLVAKGAVSIVKDAVKSLEEGEDGGQKITFDPERKAAMVSNLLTVLVSDKDATPVLNVGTLHA